MRIVVCSTLAAYVCDDQDTCVAWLANAEELVGLAEEWGHEVSFFAALELDGRGVKPFKPLLSRMASMQLAGARVTSWDFTLDDGRTEVTTENRLRHITTGQNLCVDYALAHHFDAMLFMAADCTPNADLQRLIDELETHKIVGGQVDTYCLDGPPCSCRSLPDRDIRAHMPTAAYVLIDCGLFQDGLRWRWDYVHGSDDPCLYRDARELHGVIPVVNHSLHGRHYPEAIPPIEDRGHDRRVEF